MLECYSNMKLLKRYVNTSSLFLGHGSSNAGFVPPGKGVHQKDVHDRGGKKPAQSHAESSLQARINTAPMHTYKN